jgi:hypothetical protein
MRTRHSSPSGHSSSPSTRWIATATSTAVGGSSNTEELIRTRIDLVPARSRHLAANDGLDVISHSRVTIAQLFEKGSGVLDIGEQEGDQAGWEVRDPRRSALDPKQLPRHEADGIDAVPHRGV